MAVTLAAGEVVNNCDTDNFTPGDIGDGDIIAKEGTQYIGLKISNGTNTFITTTLGAGAPYDFSATGAENGYHFIMWYDALTAVNTTTGFRLYVQDTTTSDNGFWSFAPPPLYSGGWVSRVVNPADNFTGVAGTWATTGNPAQLNSIAGVGLGFTTITMIAGNFQNCCIDQITIGTGLRVDAGSVTTPNSWETLRVADEDTAVYGWVTSAAGGIVVKGGIFIGPATGTATSVFDDTARSVLFADEPVADGFYQINMRGANTTVTQNQCILRTEDPSGNANSRWDLLVDATSTPTFTDNASLYSGSGTITLRTSSTLNGTTLDDGNSLVQNGADLDGCTIQNANTADGVAYITCDDITAISNCEFNFSDGHALELTSAHPASPTELTFSGNTFVGAYGGTPGSNLVASSGSTDAMIYNNSGKALIINITSGGTEPSIRNGAGATTTINANVNVTVTILDTNGNAIPGVEVAMFQDNGTVVFASTTTDENGQIASSAAQSLGGVVIRARQSTNTATFDTTTGITGNVITTAVNHHFQNGDSFLYDKDGGTAGTGLTDQTTYYAGNVTTNTLEVYDTAANAIAGGATGRQTLTSGGGETHKLNPIRYRSASAAGTIGASDFSASITMITDILAAD